MNYDSVGIPHSVDARAHNMMGISNFMATVEYSAHLLVLSQDYPTPTPNPKLSKQDVRPWEVRY